MRRPIAAALVSLVLLNGCAGTIPVPTTVETPGMPNPESALRNSMQHVDAEMAELGTMRVAPVQEDARTAPVLPEDLQLAQSIGYTFYVTAPPGAPNIQVSIEVHGVPAFEAFKALGDAAGTRATVEVDPLHHQVQVIHHA
jgi:defect-in-organelle-trafficking protein DotD